MPGVASPPTLGTETGPISNGSSEATDAARAAVRPERDTLSERVASPISSGLISTLLPSFESLAKDLTASWRRAVAAVGGLPGILIGLALTVLVWTRMLPLEQGYWGDELVSVVSYIDRGPSGIFGHYVPNDHMLFELLEWATVAIVGNGSAAIHRFWAVFPAIAAVALMTWWLWRRLDRWVAAIFAVLATASPMTLDLGTEARGYGLGFLSGALMVIAADRFAWRQSRSALALFAVGALIGIWTLPVIVLPFLGIALVLLAHRALRRRVLGTVAFVGVASLFFYLPVIGDLFKSSEQQFGAKLPWYALITRPVQDLLTPNVSLLFPRLGVTVCALIAGALLVVGLRALLRAPERLLALLLIAPAVFTYTVLEFGRFYVVDTFSGAFQLSVLEIADRFTSFVLLPLLVAVAVGLVDIGRRLALRAPVPWLGLSSSVPRYPPWALRTLTGRLSCAAVAVFAVTASWIALEKINSLAHNEALVPLESVKEVGAIVKGTRLNLVVTNATHPADIQHYISTGQGGRVVKTLSPAKLEALFCSQQARLIYIYEPLHASVAVPGEQATPQPGAIPPKSPAATAKGGASAGVGSGR
jgi:hypothetical protein